MKNTSKFIVALTLCCAIISLSSVASAQDQGDVLAPDETSTLPTLFSVKLSGGYGLGRGRQLYGNNGADKIFWSTGQGAKMDMAFDIPLLPIDLLNSDGEAYGPEKIPYVGLELEFATGYHLSIGGTTNDQLPSGGFVTTTRTSTYIPITLGFNARTSFGAGLPSVYIGVGGGIHIKGIYEDNISYSNSTQTANVSYDPPLPFELYGTIGMELPLLYSPEDGNSAIDLFAQLRLSEVTNYIYQYTYTPSSGTSTVVKTTGDPARTASNVALNLGFKINLY